MTANIDEATGIAYGYISADALDPETVDQLLYGPQAVNLDYSAARGEFMAEARRDHREARLGTDSECDDDSDGDFDEHQAECDFNDEYQGEEETIEGALECEGYGKVHYCTSYLGGALNFFIFKSPFSTDKARRASPCVPNAGILDTLDGSVTAYDVPADWRAA